VTLPPSLHSSPSPPSCSYLSPCPGKCQCSIPAIRETLCHGCAGTRTSKASSPAQESKFSATALGAQHPSQTKTSSVKAFIFFPPSFFIQLNDCDLFSYEGDYVNGDMRGYGQCVLFRRLLLFFLVILSHRYTFPVNPEFNKASVCVWPCSSCCLCCQSYCCSQVVQLLCLCNSVLGTVVIGSTASVMALASK
jgi:hypothetical protein